MAQVSFTPLLIDGEERPSSSSDVYEVRRQQTGTLVGTAALANAQDCLAAVDAAARAFKTWEKSRLADRRNILLKAADLFASERWTKLLMQANAEEVSLAPHWSAFDGNTAAAYLRAQAGLFDQLKGEFYPSASVPGATVYGQRRAKGVIHAIAPWNVPVVLAVRSIAIPIFCGNTLVYKGSELTPKTHFYVAKIFQEAGLPNGVLNYISFPRDFAPARTAEIIAHPQVRLINFTGSPQVGKLVALEAAKHLKPCVLELGGKAPSIILNNANLEDAAKSIAFGAMANSGQICMSTERIIIHKDIAEIFTIRVREIIAALKAGDSILDPTAKLGPLFSEQSAQRFLDLINKTREAGAQVFLGDVTRDKATVQPHIINGVRPGMALWEEESFGPVIACTTFDTVEEAIELANASPYSLTSSVWTQDIEEAQTIAFELRFGSVNINGITLHSEPSDGLIGLGGTSGYGKFDMEHFTDRRTTIVHPKGRKLPLV